LGFVRKKSLQHRLPNAAAPAFLGLVAAFALSAQVTPAASASTVAHHAAPTTRQRELSGTWLQSVIRQVAAAQELKTAQKPPAKYTVRAGDSLSAIARKLYNNPDAWPVLYWANHRQIRWANNISEGQVLTVPAKPAKIPAAPSQLGPASVPAPASAAAAEPASGQASSSGTTQAASTYSGSSSFQQCVIARESGGNSQVMNSSGHYGLYQFSSSTWAAYGGNPADFGNASVAEQNQVFANAIAAGGQSNWSAYDGC